MAKLDRWNTLDVDSNPAQCVCRYCTSGADSMGYYVGESCPKCLTGQIIPSDKFNDWVQCEFCNFQAREATEAERTALTGD